jgi:hypothetical protein
MSKALKVYSPKQVICTFCSQEINSGYADGDFLTIAPIEPTFTAKRGTDGETTRSQSLRTRGARSS